VLEGDAGQQPLEVGGLALQGLGHDFSAARRRRYRGTGLRTEVWDAIRARDIPYNALHDQGYRSIGCAPCTRPTVAGEDVRAGRWWWEIRDARECGLHVAPDGSLVRAKEPA